jgi:antitoxin ParD1/3/4
MTIHTEIGQALETFVQGLVASGRYHSPDEVLREALRLFQEREARLATLDAAIARGLAEVAAGRVKPAAEVFDAFEAKYQAAATLARGQSRASSAL